LPGRRSYLRRPPLPPAQPSRAVSRFPVSPPQHPLTAEWCERSPSFAEASKLQRRQLGRFFRRTTLPAKESAYPDVMLRRLRCRTPKMRKVRGIVRVPVAPCRARGNMKPMTGNVVDLAAARSDFFQRQRRPRRDGSSTTSSTRTRHLRCCRTAIECMRWASNSRGFAHVELLEAWILADDSVVQAGLVCIGGAEAVLAGNKYCLEDDVAVCELDQRPWTGYDRSGAATQRRH